MSRILLVGKGAPERGGIPSYLDLLLSSDLAREHDLVLLNLTHGGERAGGRATLGNLRRTARDAWAVYRSSLGADIVHLHSALAPAVTVLRAGLLSTVARLAGARVIVHAHGGLVQLWCTGAVRPRLLRLALRCAHRVAAVSSDGERVLRGLIGDRVVKIPNGVDTESFSPGDGPAHQPPRVLFVGLLTPRKGVLDLADASRLLLEEGLAHELWLVGGTPDEGPEAEAAVRAQLPAHAQLLGVRERDAMPAIYREADVFCLPSWWEAAPLSILEAMSCGLPVVATEVGEVPLMLPDGRAGLLVAPRTPVALAAALRHVITDQSVRTSMGVAARRTVLSDYSARATLGRLATVYDELGARSR